MVDQKYNASKEYDRYYGKGGGYTERYKGSIIPRNRDLVVETALECVGLTYDGVVVVLDDGCGDGRYKGVINDLASRGVTSHWVGYDVSMKGLEVFHQSLLEMGFEEVGGEGFHETDSAYVASELKRADGSMVKLVHGSIDVDTSVTKKLIGPVDMTMCMFGVLSHVPLRSDRQDILRMFAEITSGQVLFTVPSSFLTSMLQIDSNKLNIDTNPDGESTLPGDITYAVGNGVRNRFHVYNLGRLKEDLEAAGLNAEIGVANVIPQTSLVTKPVLAELDKFFSKLLSTNFLRAILPIDKVGRFLFAKAPGNRDVGVILDSVQEFAESPGCVEGSFVKRYEEGKGHGPPGVGFGKR